LQDRCGQRVGDEDWIDVDPRLICAAHQDVRAMVEQGKSREDL